MLTESQKEISGIKITLLETNILRFEVPENTHITLEIMKELWEYSNSVFPNGKRKVLGVFNSSFKASKEAADFMVSPLRAQTLIAEAFVINSVALKMMTNFYITIKRPPVSSKVFDDEELALAWLKARN